MKIIKKFNKIGNINKFQKNVRLTSNVFSKRFCQSNKIGELVEKINNMEFKLDHLTKIVNVNKYENYDVKNIIPTNESIKIQPCVELFDKNKFNEYAQNKQFDILLNFKNIDYQQINMKKLIIECKYSYHVINHIIDNLVNCDNQEMSILELLTKYGNQYSLFTLSHYIKKIKITNLNNGLLFWACENKNSLVFDYLIKSNLVYSDIKKNLNKLDDKGNSLLAHAYKHDNIEVFKMLLDNGADVNLAQKFDIFHDTKLIHTICNSYSDSIKNIDYLKLIIEYGADVNSVDVNSAVFHKWTPLHYAIKQNNFVMIKYLVVFGANVNANAFNFIDDYYSPICMILEKQYSPERTIDMISALGSELDLTQKICNTNALQFALDVCFSSNKHKSELKINVDIQVAKHLLKHYVLYNTNYIELLHENIYDSDPDMYGMKLAHYACIMEDIGLLKQLINNKVNVNVQDNFGNTPDHYICMFNNYEMCKLLFWETRELSNKYDKYPSNYSNRESNSYRILMNFIMFICCTILIISTMIIGGTLGIFICEFLYNHR